MSKVIIWGLRDRRHSHKFIHSGFFRNLSEMGFETLWVEDERANSDLIKSGDVVFAVDVASDNLPIVRNAKYVLHNLDPEKIGISNDYLILQVHTRDVPGINLGLPWVSWDKENQTLYQPWGVPSDSNEWLSYNSDKSNTEYWVGSVWNNNLDQGNKKFISNYTKALMNRNIKFKIKGNSTILKKEGISEGEAQRLINISPIGAAVVGEWQKDSLYIPCRLFKNIAAGAFPCSNADFSELLGSTGAVFTSDPEILIDKISTLGKAQKIKSSREAQEAIKPYTYKNGIKRILECLG